MSIESKHGMDEPGYTPPRKPSLGERLEAAGQGMQTAGDQMSSCGGSLVKLGCSGFLVLAVVVLVAGFLSSSKGSSTAVPTATEPQPAATTSTEAPTLERGPAAGTLAESCGDEVTANSHTSCPFAEKVHAAFAGRYESAHEAPATINAYSPVTDREYQLRCSLVSGGGTVECATGTAAVVFPLSTVQTEAIG